MCVTEGQELEDQSVTSLQSAARQPYLCVFVSVRVCVRERHEAWEGRKGV